jgi:hypothetical protein
MPVPAISFGVVFHRLSGDITRIFNPDFEIELDLHHVGPAEFMLRLDKAEYGIGSAANSMMPADVYEIIGRLRSGKP